MAARILYITGQTVTLYSVRRKRVEKLGQYACDDSGYKSVCAMLLDDEPQPVSILVDLIEEEFREETLPHAMGGERAALHARHAGKLYRSTPFRHQRVVERQKQGRRDDRVLFCALTNRENIEPLLAILDDAGIPVTGVYSLPIVSRHLIKPLGAQTGNILLVSRQPDEGLRETFVRNGQVHFSRLAPITEQSPANFGQILSAEARKTRRYLHTLRLLPHDQPLDVFALCDSERLAALQNMPEDGGDIRIQGINIAHLAQLLGLQNFPDTSLSDSLFCYLLHRHRSANHYARSHDLRNWHTHLARQGLRAATWLIAVGALTLSGMNVVDSLQLARETRSLADAGTRVSAAYEGISQHLPVTPETALAMREAIALADHINAYPVNLDELYRLVGDVFSARPAVTMDKFSWFVAADPKADKAVLLQQTADKTVSLADSHYLISRISGHIRDFNGNYAEAQRQIAQIADRLAAQAHVIAAEIVRKPLNTRADNNLQGGLPKNGDREIAEFELRIVLELTHAPV